MPSAAERFWAKVDRGNDHDLWTGARDQRGVGMVRINGKLRTVQRAAWELANGPLPDGARVQTCAAERACVRLEHLTVEGTTTPQAVDTPRRRRRRGSGSIRQLHPGVWKLTVPDDTAPSSGRRRYLTVRGTRHDANTAMHTLLLATTRSDLGDLRVRELVARYLDTVTNTTNTAEHGLLHEVIEPTFGPELAAVITAADIHDALRATIRDGTPPDTAWRALRLLRAAYGWAAARRWCKHNPTDGLTRRSLT